MNKRKNYNQLPPGTKIDVVMRKEMTVEQYYKMYDEAKKKGWHIQGFQKGFVNK